MRFEEKKSFALDIHKSQALGQTTIKTNRPRINTEQDKFGKLHSEANEMFRDSLDDDDPNLNRHYSISELRMTGAADKAKKLKDLHQKIEHSKLVLKTILNALFVTPKYIPSIIRIFLKIVSELYEKHIKINNSFYNKTNELTSSDSAKAKMKSEIHRLLIDILATKWLVNSIFMCPDNSGLINNRSVQPLSDIFSKFSKVFVYTLRGKTSSKNASEESFMILFISFIEEHHKNSKRFMRSVLNINTNDIIPKGIKTEKFEEFAVFTQKRTYSDKKLIDILCISEGLIHKIFYSYAAILDNIHNSKLQNSVKTLGKFSAYDPYRVP
jgi:hypothetical protein